MTGRLEANFRDLVGLFPSTAETWQTVPPPESYRRMLTGDDYLDWWRGHPGRDGTPIGTVMGYCVGSVFAAELIDDIEHAQGSRPRLVLFDPETPNTRSLYRDFEKVVAMMTVLTPEEADALRADAVRVSEDHGDDFDAASGRLVELYEAAGSAAFLRMGLDEDLGVELLGLFRAYVSYLAAARKLDPAHAWTSATAITSAGSSTGARLAARELRFDTGHDELLRHGEAARAAFDAVYPGGV